MGVAEILVVLVVAAVGWFVWDSLEAREAANSAIRRACAAEGLLFLDDTVALDSVWPARDAEGRLQLRRAYGFEYSDTGNNRRKGTVTLLGNDVHAVDVGVRQAPESETLH